MKLLTTLAILVMSAAALSACQVSARDRDTSVSVSNNGDAYHGTHCPPGHAKKGWC